MEELDITYISVTGSMHRKMPQEDPNTGHAVAVDVRDAKQFMPSCSRTTGAFCRAAPKQKTAGVGPQGSKENPTPASTVCHGFGCIRVRC